MPENRLFSPMSKLYNSTQTMLLPIGARGAALEKLNRENEASQAFAKASQLESREQKMLHVHACKDYSIK